MKAKRIIALIAGAALTAAIFTCACGKEQVVYDAGEYGTVKEGTKDVTANAGYRFIGWSDPVKDGRKTVYTAKYLHREYYLSEVKKVYEFEQGEMDCGVCLKYKITDMQTGVVDYEVDSSVVDSVMRVESSNSEHAGRSSGGLICVNSTADKEWETVVTITVNDNDYNIHQEFSMHCVKNRIPAESVEIYTYKNSHEVKLDGSLYFYSTVLPENTSFAYCTYSVLRVERGTTTLTGEDAAKVGYFQGNAGLRLGEDAQVGDVICVQAENRRDPQIKSNEWLVTVV